MTYSAGIKISGMNWCSSKPSSPIIGDCYVDPASSNGYIFNGKNWEQFASVGSSESPKSFVPTEEQLDKHPALKQAWDEYLVIWKLLGL